MHLQGNEWAAVSRWPGGGWSFLLPIASWTTCWLGSSRHRAPAPQAHGPRHALPPELRHLQRLQRFRRHAGRAVFGARAL